jgi:predicted ferric reductase
VIVPAALSRLSAGFFIPGQDIFRLFTCRFLGQILIPFISTHCPPWVGIGILSFYIILLVTITFYLRARIGLRTFRTIHVFSLLSYLGVAVHELFAGTDATLSSTKILYAVTGLVVTFLTIYWLILKIQPNQETSPKPVSQHPAARHKTAAR